MIKLALRSLLGTPVYTVVSLLTLGLGIGVNTSMYSLLHATLLRPLPYAQPEGLVRVFRTSPTSNTMPHAPGNFDDFRVQDRNIIDLAGRAIR